ncbi:DUF3108 domain-containing protein [Roseisolibacter sp. H3M3-2]|uniref:DUF3108 domain-containing protein n=1 Tax=Roseisolibacter sp. H3M3-2 TaxID=3031323 RepID=UPI0023D9CA30|nr:DUF3108 domain-containing protein [Roseisolibacter sp. H3M3-2]MDF1504015.1 DUF3108 domain-containing protein [Roseisolibacter sp. H3M3-2]
MTRLALLPAFGLLAALAVHPAAAQSLAAQPLTGAGAVAPTGDDVAARPFKPGERLTYDVKFGPIKAGTGSMEVRGLETVRGRPAYHTVFRVKGGVPGFRVLDVFESWFARDDLSSLRFHKDQDEGPKERTSRFEIFPERATYDDLRDDRGELPSTDRPLDDGSFLYYIRTVPLVVGQTYRFEQYFKPDRNPVTIRVLRREKVTVPAGTFDAIVVQPTIKTSGIFGEGGRAEVWISDDDRRIILQLKSKLSFGSLNLYLTDHKAGSN